MVEIERNQITLWGENMEILTRRETELSKNRGHSRLLHPTKR